MSLIRVGLQTVYNHSFEREFNTQSYCIPQMYWSFLRFYDLKKNTKCGVILNDFNRTIEYKEPSFIDYKAVNMPFDFNKFFKLGKQEKKQMQLEVLHQGMMNIAEREGWATNPLLDAYNGCLKKNLDYQFLVNDTLKSSKDHNYKIGFWCNWDLDIFELYWVLFDKNENEIRRNLLFKKESHQGEYVNYLNWRWQDNETIVLESRYSGKEKHIFKIN
jgi:hypothetical protein